MSYCYVDDDTTSDQASPTTHHYHLMPESPLQPKLSTNHTTNTANHLNRTNSNMSPNTQLEQEKRLRREIANSNERRRMQSINTGFQSLKILIPHSCGEKLSKACILQRAADHIKALETEKIKLQSQNEQFRILIKSFHIDSTSVLQSQRRLSNNEQDDTILVVNNDTRTIDHVDIDDDRISHCHSMKSRQLISSRQQVDNNNTRYPSLMKDESQDTSMNSPYYPSSSCPTVTSSYQTNSSLKSKGSSSTISDTPYLIVKAHQPSQRSYKTSSLDQTNENGTMINERCNLRTQSVDTNNNTNPSPVPSNQPVPRRGLHTIVEAIRHVEGDEALSNITSQSSSSYPSSNPQEDLPAQIKAMIHEKFQQQTNRNSANNNTLIQQTINIYEQITPTATVSSISTPTMSTTNSNTHDIDLHHKPPKKRKITYNENDDLIEPATTIPKQDLSSLSSPDFHFRQEDLRDSPPSQTFVSNLVSRSPSNNVQLLQEHFLERTIRYPTSTFSNNNVQQHSQI